MTSEMGGGGTGAKIATGNVLGMAGAGTGSQDSSGAADPYTASTMLKAGQDFSELRPYEPVQPSEERVVNRKNNRNRGM